MTATAKPFGMLPVRKVGGKPYNGSFTHYNIQNSATGSLFYGDPVQLKSGYIQVASVGTSSTYIGVFMGCYYTDPTSKTPTWSPYYDAPISVPGSMNGRPNPVALVCDDPDTIYKVQANASVTTQDVGLNFIVTVSAGNTTFGTSRAHLEAASRASTINGGIRMVGLYDIPGNYFSNEVTTDLYPIVEVVIVANQHRSAAVSAP